MKLTQREISPSPISQKFTRLSGKIQSDNGQTFNIWFDIPDIYSAHISESGNPWVIVMLPLALDTGENIEIDLPVDPLLLENLKGLISEWLSWYPDLKKVRIVADNQNIEGVYPTHKAAFFSGGIDSYFTIIKHLKNERHNVLNQKPINELITVWGFDIPLQKGTEFKNLNNELQKKAEELDLHHLEIHTNLRDNQTLWRSHWGPLTHAAGLALIGHVLEKRYYAVLFGSAFTYGDLRHWGSHPMTDQLFSSSSMVVVHDGAAYTRVEKTIKVAKLDIVMNSLHVCYHNQSATNCSHCLKCYRSMMTIDILNRKDVATTFDWDLYDNKKGIFLYSDVEISFFREISELARNNQRSDIVLSIKTSMLKSKLPGFLLKILYYLTPFRGGYRLYSLAEKLLLRGMIT